MTTKRFVTETFRFSVLDEISCGFAVFGDFLRDFAVYYRPLRPSQQVMFSQTVVFVFDSCNTINYQSMFNFSIHLLN